MLKSSIKFLSIVLFIGTGLVFNTSEAFSQKSGVGSERAESNAISYLRQKGVNTDELRSSNVVADAKGSHVRFSQYINGIRVYGSEIITHEKANGKFAPSTGELFNGSALQSYVTFSKEAAVDFVSSSSFWDMTSAQSELVYYPHDQELVLAYMIDAKNTDVVTDNPRREMIVLNAQTGEIIDRWNNLQTGAALGTGYGFYAGTVSNFPIDLTGSTYSMFDVPNNGKTTDYSNKTCPPVGCSSIGSVYTSSGSVFGTNGSLSNRVSIGVDAHFFAQKTLAYYSTFGRNGIDNNNNKNLKFGYMVSRTHYGRNYNNAYWDGSSMTYGDGDGSTYRPFDALDVVGHEMTHGVTERTSNLQYQNESGAANESFSDIFGVIIEFKTGTLTGSGGVSYPADWWIGEDLYYSNNPSSPTRGIRNMANTHSEGDPDHYSERYTGTSDNGGVHTNSGIQNFMFYLLVNGGTNHKDTTGTIVTGIGLDDAAAVAYYADTAYCTSTDTYAKVANAWVNAAKFLYGSGTKSQQTYNAWKACGVTPTVAP